MKNKSLPVIRTTSLALILAAFAAGSAVAATPPAAPATSTSAQAEERKFQRVADVKRGDRVVLRGEVTRILDEDEFILTDESGRIRIYIGWRNEVPVSRGDRMIVEGRADDDTIFGMRPEIYARVLELENGKRINLVP